MKRFTKLTASAIAQGQLGSGRRAPRWACAPEPRQFWRAWLAWHGAWHEAAESAPFAVCAAAAEQLLRVVADASGDEEVMHADGAFAAVADATLIACRAAECWEGGLHGTL